MTAEDLVGAVEPGHPPAVDPTRPSADDTLGTPSTAPALLLGDEAVGLAALHAGITGAYAYPGTPSTEILEYIQHHAKDWDVHAWWAANEKVAYEQAVGVSYAGRRVIVSMKHVGLNVAMDPFMSSALTGVHGSLVVVVADDPGMHSSQNEQDSRVLAQFALLPCLEPMNPQEAYRATRDAFELSEAVRLPVVVRLVTQLAHNRGEVVAEPVHPQNPLSFDKDRAYFTLLPANARECYQRLIAKQPELQRRSETGPWNRLSLEPASARRAVISSGIATNYVREALGGEVPYPHLHVGMYPFPSELVRRLLKDRSEVFVVEEGYPVIEQWLRSAGQSPSPAIHGKLDGTFPRAGELTVEAVAEGFGRGTRLPKLPTLDPLPGRPPRFCPGCPHSDTYPTIKEALRDHREAPLFADIGCYTLGYYPPYDAVDTTLEMGASIGMAVGAYHAGIRPAIAIIGDSTFGHSGISSLLSAVKEEAGIKVFILDNGSVAMTGNQETIAEGDDLVRLIQGLGIPPERIRLMRPHPQRMAENVALIREELAQPGISVIISRRMCVLHRRRQQEDGT